jgi:hypothetical protein
MLETGADVDETLAGGGAALEMDGAEAGTERRSKSHVPEVDGAMVELLSASVSAKTSQHVDRTWSTGVMQCH